MSQESGFSSVRRPREVRSFFLSVLQLFSLLMDSAI